MTEGWPSTVHTVDAELEHPAPPVSDALARDLAARYFRLDVTSAQALPGERDRNFLLHDATGHRFTLKVIHPLEPPEVTDFQTMLLDHLGRSEIARTVPELIPAVDGERDALWAPSGGPGRRLRCTTYLEGPLLYTSPPSVVQLRSLGGTLARVDKALADFRHPAEDRSLLWDVQTADRILVILDAVEDRSRRRLVGRLLERFAGEIRPQLADLRRQVIHNDLNPHNIVLHGSGDDSVAAIIDFGDALRAPLIQDLATAGAYQVGGDGHPLAGVAELGSAFYAVTPLTDEEVRLLPELITARLAISPVIAAWRSRRDPDNAAYIHRNYRHVWEQLDALVGLSREGARSWLARNIVPKGV